MSRKTALLILGFAIAALSGCSTGNSNAPGSMTGMTADQASVQTSLTEAPELVSDGLFDAPTTGAFSSRPMPGGLTGIEGDGTPVSEPYVPSAERHWWREITGATRTFSYEFTATDSMGRPRLAHVVVHKHFTGILHVAWADVVPSSSGGDSLIRHHVQKLLKDHWVRHLWLARVAPDSSHDREWRLIAASGAEVTSEIADGGAQPQIQSIRVQMAGQDSTFSDPAAAILWHRLWSVPGGSQVTVTVTTNAPDDVVVLMHHDARLLLAPNGDNTYTGTWETQNAVGLNHFGVNALSHATVFDPQAGYHSHAWLFPFLHRGEAYRE